MLGHICAEMDFCYWFRMYARNKEKEGIEKDILYSIIAGTWAVRIPYVAKLNECKVSVTQTC